MVSNNNKPILKADIDPRDSFSYRGITLISVPYHSVNKCWYTNWTGSKIIHPLLMKGQNGFRKRRSCLDHLYSLTRKCKQKDTYVCLIEMEKTFDCVNRNLFFIALSKLECIENSLHLWNRFTIKHIVLSR